MMIKVLLDGKETYLSSWRFERRIGAFSRNVSKIHVHVASYVSGVLHVHVLAYLEVFD